MTKFIFGSDYGPSPRNVPKTTCRAQDLGEANSWIHKLRGREVVFFWKVTSSGESEVLESKFRGYSFTNAFDIAFCYEPSFPLNFDVSCLLAYIYSVHWVRSFCPINNEAPNCTYDQIQNILPFNVGKQKYGGKKSFSKSSKWLPVGTKAWMVE
ncbi:hypothetical protein NC651_022752 [Populus alba x Populus x berolinensis]|nr:hypothetical protein NC651_022752 [Populus alba x Populus x berolinensis]